MRRGSLLLLLLVLALLLVSTAVAEEVKSSAASSGSAEGGSSSQDEEDSEEEEDEDEEPAATPQPGPKKPSHILSLNSSTLDPVLANMKEDVIVEFFAPWCHHCQAFAPIYEEVAVTLEGDKIKCANVDCVANDPLCDRFGVKGYPTILFMPAKGGRKTVYAFEGKRDHKSVVEFVRQGFRKAAPVAYPPVKGKTASAPSTPSSSAKPGVSFLDFVRRHAALSLSYFAVVAVVCGGICYIFYDSSTGRPSEVDLSVMKLV